MSGAHPALPASVRYVKNGTGGHWWPNDKSGERLFHEARDDSVPVAPDVIEIELRLA